MPTIRPLRTLDAELLRTLISGYTSTERFSVTTDCAQDHLRFAGALMPCDSPFVKVWLPPGSVEVERYAALAAAGHVFGALSGSRAVGLAICEPTAWNRSLTLWELHVAAGHRRHGVGRALVRAVMEHARAQSVRRIWLETQTTNVPAIRFYQALGFRVVGLDLSLYGNDDAARGEVALYMARAVE